MSCGADISANELMQNLLAGKDFTVPNVELNSDSLKLPQGINSEMYSSILRLTIADLTEGKVGGNGAFDALMTSIRAHLLQEYEKGRITGGEYTKAYAELVAAGMAQATQFVLNKDQVYWAAQQSQIQAVTAMIQMESERMRLAALKYEALTSEANYALTKLKLANEDMQYCMNKFNLEQMLPKQAEGLNLDNAGKTISNNIASYNLCTILPNQAALLEAQKDGQMVQNEQGRYTLRYLMPAQLDRSVAEVEGIETNTSISRYNLEVLLPVQLLTNKYTLEQMMPGQKSLLDAQVIGQLNSNDKTRYEITNMLPKQAEGLGLENDGKSISNDTATYNLASILPKQAAMLDAQKEGQLAKNDQDRYTLQYLMPLQRERIIADIDGVEANTSIARYNLNTLLPLQNLTGKYTLEEMMPSQKAMLDAQKAGVDIANETAEYNKDVVLPAQLKLTQEQTETQRAQTLDSRSDGATVVGYVGKQKDLYSQQIDSYKRDAEIKAAKLVSDGWMTQKTIDEAALTPASFQQNMVDSVLNRVKQNNGLA